MISGPRHRHVWPGGCGCGCGGPVLAIHVHVAAGGELAPLGPTTTSEACSALAKLPYCIPCSWYQSALVPDDTHTPTPRLAPQRALTLVALGRRLCGRPAQQLSRPKHRRPAASSSSPANHRRLGPLPRRARCFHPPRAAPSSRHRRLPASDALVTSLVHGRAV
jgi:hypothetical protein